MKKAIVFWSIAVAVSFVVFAGCGKSDPSSNTSNSSTIETDESTVNEISGDESVNDEELTVEEETDISIEEGQGAGDF